MLTIDGSRNEGLTYSSPFLGIPEVSHPYVDESWGPLNPFGTFFGYSLFPESFAPLLEALGYGTSDATITIDLLGERPINSEYRRGTDDWRFGAGFFPSQVPSYPRPRAEKEVVHRTFTGRGISTRSPDASLLGNVGDNDYSHGVKLPGRFSYHRIHTSLSFNGEWSIGPVAYDGVGLRSAADVHQSLLNHGSDIWLVDSYPGYPHAIVVKSILGSLEPGSLTITFYGEYRLFPFATNPAEHIPHAYVSFTDSFRWVSTPPKKLGSFQYVHGEYPLTDFSSVTRFLKFGDYSQNTYPFSVDPQFTELSGESFTGFSRFPGCVTSSILTPGYLVSRFDNGFNERYQVQKPSFALDNFSRKVERDVVNLLPAVFYSSADAVMKHVSVLKSNNLENLSQLGGLLELAPDAGKFINALVKGKNGDLLGAGATLFDLWSENKLREDFGWNPTVADITEISESYSNVVRVFQEQGIWGERTLYGKFDYELPNNCYGSGSAHLTVRSKVRVTFSHTSLLASLIKGQAIGLIPSLGNLWDLVPFSFVADWLWNIGDRLNDIDAQMFMLVLPVHFAVHSLTVTSFLSDADLDFLEVRPYPAGFAQFPGLRFYMRIPSLRLPFLRDSIYDFRAAHGPSDLATAGALAYTLMKG